MDPVGEHPLITKIRILRIAAMVDHPEGRINFSPESLDRALEEIQRLAEAMLE